MIRTITFKWDDRLGECEDCGLPVAFEVVDAYGHGRNKAVCSVCAANDASEGNMIQRKEQQ